jgi:hypothetical protein
LHLFLSFAQQGNVKEAKSIIEGTNPDFAKAEQLIGSALTDPSTSKDPATWDVAGKVQSKINEKENTKLYLKQAFDTTKMYNSILEMYKYFLKCDELAQIPNDKGKIKNKFRKENSASLMMDRANLINGGVLYFNKNQNAEALKFFGTYIESAKYPMLESYNLVTERYVVVSNFILCYFSCRSFERLQCSEEVCSICFE